MKIILIRSLSVYATLLLKINYIMESRNNSLLDIERIFRDILSKLIDRWLRNWWTSFIISRHICVHTFIVENTEDALDEDHFEFFSGIPDDSRLGLFPMKISRLAIKVTINGLHVKHFSQEGERYWFPS